MYTASCVFHVRVVVGHDGSPLLKPLTLYFSTHQQSPSNLHLHLFKMVFTYCAVQCSAILYTHWPSGELLIVVSVSTGSEPRTRNWVNLFMHIIGITFVMVLLGLTVWVENSDLHHCITWYNTRKKPRQNTRLEVS